MEDRDHGGPAENLPDQSPARDVVVGGDIVGGDEGDGGSADGGFTFPVPPAVDGFIVPVYPIFGRPLSPQPEEEEPETATLRVPLGQLLLEEREFRAGQRDGSQGSQLQQDEEDIELEGVPPESYCLWAPGQSAPASPRRCRKSGSTGSVLRWRGISERLVGRSHSDGKEKFVFLSTGPGPPKQDDDEEGGSKGDGAVGVGASGHGWSYYGKGGGSGAVGRRRSYLPYKQEFVELFANVSGLRRSYPPF